MFVRTKQVPKVLNPPKQGDVVLFILAEDSVIYKGLVLQVTEDFYRITACEGSLCIGVAQVATKADLKPNTFYKVQKDSFGKPSVRITHIKYYKCSTPINLKSNELISHVSSKNTRWCPRK